MNEKASDELDAKLASLSETNSNFLYYAITLVADKNNKIEFCTHTQWAGWADECRQIELRRARPVFPAYVELWRRTRQPYAVIHTPAELTLFLIGGGHALVEKGLAESIFPHMLGADTSLRYGQAGFISPDLLDESAFNRAPTPKMRMEVLKRDGRRCRICGRRPDDHVDVVLNVHHIRLWATGGATDPSNLITLCHTCHMGLKPHYDPSLYEYLKPESDDPIEQALNELKEGIAQYRRIGFLSTVDKKKQKRNAKRPRRSARRAD
jgi:hypothetical protein